MIPACAPSCWCKKTKACRKQALATTETELKRIKARMSELEKQVARAKVDLHGSFGHLRCPLWTDGCDCDYDYVDVTTLCCDTRCHDTASRNVAPAWQKSIKDYFPKDDEDDY